jgi:hypothetical protein
VAVLAGPEVDRRLASAGALALAADATTVLLSSRLAALPRPMRLLVVGHELAHTVQHRRGGSDAEASLEAEAWQAAATALRGQPYAIRGRAGRPLPAEALVSDQMAVEYFTTFPQLLEVRVTRAHLIARSHSDMTFERILDLMLASKDEDFIIDLHGNEVGIFAKLAKGSSIDATKMALLMLMQLAHIKQAMRDAGGDLARWKETLAEIEPAIRALRNMAKTMTKRKAGVPNVDINWQFKPSEIDEQGVEFARVTARAWVDGMVKGLDLKEAKVDELIDKMLRLQKRELTRIEFRSCKMGKDLDALWVFRKFFGSKRVGAPDVRSGIGKLTPPPRGTNLGPGAIDFLLRGTPLAKVYGDVKGKRLAIHLTIAPSPRTDVTVVWAADSSTAVTEWVAEHIMERTKFNPRSIPIHFLELTPPVFPKDPEYRLHIKDSSHLWWKVAGELPKQPAAPGAKKKTIWERALEQ